MFRGLEDAALGCLVFSGAVPQISWVPLARRLRWWTRK